MKTKVSVGRIFLMWLSHITETQPHNIKLNRGIPAHKLVFTFLHNFNRNFQSFIYKSTMFISNNFINLQYDEGVYCCYNTRIAKL